MKTTTLICVLSFFAFFGAQAQTNLTKITNDSYANFADCYNYNYWKDNWKSSGVNDRAFANYTSSYAFSVDYSDLSINSLLINENPLNRDDAFKAQNGAIFQNNYSGDIHYAILRNGSTIHEKSSSPTSNGNSDSQTPIYGVWYNTRFVSTNFTNSPNIDKYYTGLDFSGWHNRFNITFHVRPSANITNGQLQFSVTIPEEYSTVLNSQGVYAFGLPSNKGFAVKPGSTSESVSVNGNTITITSNSQTLSAGQDYEISLLFHAVTDNLSSQYSNVFDEESEVTITANQTAPSNASVTDITYVADEALHYIDIPRHGMGYNNCSQVDVQQQIEVALLNTTSNDKRVRLCFRQAPNVNVVGFNSIICNTNGEPSGLPLQVSKNWHNGNERFYSGSWIQEFVELIVPANTTQNFIYKRTGAKWGEVFSACSHQLSIVGTGSDRGGWLQAALGSFGETITHSPDYELGSTNGADIRPFLVTNDAYGLDSSECGWTGNMGGLDMFVYQDGSSRKYQSQVKTDFRKYSPNLTETSVSAVSSDLKMKWDYTFYMTRSDDFTRVYYKVKIEALQNTSFSRLDFFQLGGDTYNIYTARNVAYGNDSGVQGQFLPTNDGSGYTTDEIALTGTNPWIWAGDGMHYDGNLSKLDIPTNNGIIIRSYKASFGGTPNNTPYFRERSASGGFAAGTGANTLPTSYCLVPPPNVNSMSAGDSVEAIIELAVLPKQAVDYYGPNDNFNKALETYGNTWELLHRESNGNKIEASSVTNNIDTEFPLTVEAVGNSALVSVTGGRGFMPIVFSGLTSVDAPKLWQSKDNDDCWELVNQSVHGNDFWQAEYVPETGRFELVYNVDRDAANDELVTTNYYLGNNPPASNILVQTKIGENPWTQDSDIKVSLNEAVSLAPQITELGVTSVGEGVWSWTGPNGFSQIGRVVNFDAITSNDLGTYISEYTPLTGCVSYQEFVLSTDDETESFIPDPNKVYYIDAIYHNLRLASSGESEDAYTTTINTVGADVEWKFVDKGNGYWHVQRAAGGSTPRLRTDNTQFADMQATAWNGTYTYYEITTGYIENTHFLTLPDGPTDYQRLQVNNTGEVRFVPTSHALTWESFRIIEAPSSAVSNNTNTVTIQENGAGFCNVDGPIDNNNEGFTGNGFANTFNELGNGVEWEINGPSGDYTFTWRYASVNDRPANLLVNGGVTSSNIPFVATGSWIDWTSQSTTRTLPAGVKTMRLESLTSDGLGNIDYVEITGPNVSVSNCSQSSKNILEDSNNGIVIYPNPVVSTAIVQGAVNSTLEVYDITGRVLLIKNILNEDEQIDLSGFSSGVYYAKLSSLQSVDVIKIVKQ